MLDKDLEKEVVEQSTTVYGDQVGGDKTTVGNMTGVKGVAIGRGATVIINEVTEHPWFLLLGLMALAMIAVVSVPVIRELLSERRPMLTIQDHEPFELEPGSELQDISVGDGVVWLATAAGIEWKDEKTGEDNRALEEHRITNVVTDPITSDRVWFGTGDGSIGSYNLTTNEAELIENSGLESWITIAHVDSNGSIWFADDMAGMVQLSNGNLITSTLPEENLFTNLAVFSTDLGKSLVTQTPFAIHIKYQDKWQEPYSLPDNLRSRDFASDQINSIWFAHDEGVALLNIPEDFDRRAINIALCSSAENNLPAGIVFDLEYHSSTVWLVSQGGLGRLEVTDKERDGNDCGLWQSIKTGELEWWGSLRDVQLDFSVNKSDCNTTVWLIERSTVVYHKLLFNVC